MCLCTRAGLQAQYRWLPVVRRLVCHQNSHSFPSLDQSSLPGARWEKGLGTHPVSCTTCFSLWEWDEDMVPSIGAVPPDCHSSVCPAMGCAPHRHSRSFRGSSDTNKDNSFMTVLNPSIMTLDSRYAQVSGPCLSFPIMSDHFLWLQQHHTDAVGRTAPETLEDATAENK